MADVGQAMNESAMVYRKADVSDYPGVMALQNENLITNLAPKDRSQGFLSVGFTHEQISEINQDVGIIVAAKGGDILGYLCASSCDYSRQFPVLKKMIEEFHRLQHDGISLQNLTTFIYGPVCIHKNARGMGVLENLFEALLRLLDGKYDLAVAFVSHENSRSLNAHIRKLGMKHIGEFEFNDRLFNILSFAVPK